MAFLAEQHLVAAKLVRRNGATRSGAERELFIRKSNGFVLCVRLMAKERGDLPGKLGGAKGGSAPPPPGPPTA